MAADAAAVVGHALTHSMFPFPLCGSGGSTKPIGLKTVLGGSTLCVGPARIQIHTRKKIINYQGALRSVQSVLEGPPEQNSYYLSQQRIYIHRLNANLGDYFCFI